MTAQNSPLKNEQLTVSKAADFLKISASSLRKLEQEGRIKSQRAHNGYRYFTLGDLIQLRNYIQNKKLDKQKFRALTKPYFPTVAIPKVVDNKTLEQVDLNSKRPNKFAHALVLVIALLTLITSTAAAYKKTSSNEQVALKNSGKNTGTVLADSTTVRDWRVNFNTPAFFKRLVTFEQNAQVNANLNVDGTITTPTLTFTGTGTLNQLDAIDDTTETTLENALDLAGDITSTGLNNTIINENVIGDIQLEDEIDYSGALDISGSLTFDGQTGDDGDILSSDGSGLPIWIAQSDIDAGSLEGLTSTDFLRSNESDEFSAGALSFSNNTLLDLSAITHATSSTQGLLLPQSTTLVNPSTGEGYLAYDTDDNELKIFNGTTWADVVDSTTLNESTIFDGDVTGTYNTLNIEPDVVGTTEIDDASITPADLNSLNAPVDDYILAYDAGSFKWVVDTGAAGSSKWTDAGTITYLTDTDDDLAVGGTDATSRFFFDYSAASLTVGADGAEGSLLLYSNEATDYTATLTTGTLGGNNTFTFDGASGTVLTTGNVVTSLSGWDQDSSNDLTTSTVFVGDISGTYNTIEIDADTITSTEIATDAVDSAEIVANAVGASELAATTVTLGSYGSATAIPAFTVDADGRLTAASTNTIAAPSSIESVSNNAGNIDIIGVGSVSIASDDTLNTITITGTDTNTTYTADNGLTLNGTIMELGGTLNRDTTISTSTFELYVDSIALDGSTLTVGAPSNEGTIGLFSEEGASDYTATLATGTLGANTTYTFSGATGTVLTTGNVATSLSGWDQDSSNDLTTLTNFGGHVSGTYNNIAIDENTIEGMIFDNDAETITGIWEVQDGVAFNFGTDADWSIAYDEAGDDRLEFTATGTNNAVLFDLLDTDSASTFTITNSNGSNVANLSIEGGVDTGNGVYELQDATVSNKGLASFADAYFTVTAGAVSIDDIYLLDDGDTGTGVYDFGGTTSFEITNDAAPTVNAAGEIAVDTTITDHTGLLTYFDGTEALYAIAVPTANLTTVDDQVLAYDADNNEFYFKADTDTNTTYTADNGLTLATTVFKLGGTLSGETAIATGAFDLEIDNIRLNGNTISAVNTDGNLTLNANGTGDLYFNGATYNLSDTGDLTLGGRITFENAEYIQNESNGSIVFTGVGGSNNGAIAFDLETNSLPTLVSSTDTAIGIDEDLTFIGSQTLSTTTGALNITANSGNLALSAATSGDITATPSSATALFNVLTGNLKVGDGTPTVNLDGEDGYIEGTFEVDGTSNLADTLTFAGVTTDITTGTNEALTLTPNGSGDLSLSVDNDSNVLINGTLTSTNSNDLLSSTLTNQTSSGTQRIIYLENANDAANATTEALLALNNTEGTADLVTDYFIINATTADTTADAIDVSDAELYNALNAGQNFLLGDGIRQFSPSSGTWTLENTSGTDLVSVTGSALTVGSNGSEGTIVLYSEEGGSDYTATLATGSLASSNRVYTFSGSDGTVLTTGNAATTLSTWDQDSSNDLTTSTNFGGHVSGTYNNIAIDENTIEGMIFDNDAETITGIWEVQDGVAFNFGDDANWSIAYDETTDDRLEITSSGSNNSVLFDLLDTDSDSTFTITNSNGSNAANLSVEGSIAGSTINTGNGAYEIQDATVSNKGLASFSDTYFTVSSGAVSIDDIYLLDDGDTGTGVYDFGGTTSFEITNDAAPTVNAAGEIAVDTTITDHTGLITYFDGSEALYAIAVPTANLTTVDDRVLAYDADNNEFYFKADTAGTTYTADNGLTLNGGTIMELGGTLNRDTAIATAAFVLSIDNIQFNGNAISSITSGDLDITPLTANDLDIDTVGAGGDVLIDTAAGAISLDATGVASNFTLTSDGAGDDLTVALAGATDSSLVLASTGTGADALQITASAGGIDILATGAADGEDIDITATGSSVFITSTQAVSDAIKLVASDAAGQIFFDAGSTDKTADALVLDVDVNSASVDGLFIDLDIGTALSAAEIANGINIDVAGLGTDNATSAVNGLLITGNASTGTGVMTGIDIEGTFDADINLQNDEAISNVTDGTIALIIGGNEEVLLTATALSPAAAQGNTLGTTSLEWNQIYLGDDDGINLGLDDNWTIGYDETTDDRLEFISSGSNNSVYFDVLDTDSASTFTITNSNGTYLADLSVEGSITSGNMLTVNTPVATSGTAAFINNAGTGASFRVDDVGSDTSPFIIDTSGSVGIGIETPTAKLDILPSSAAALQIQQYSTSAGATGELRFLEGGATSTQYTGFKAPDSLTSSLVYILPNHDEAGSEPSANEVLTWTTGNQLKWQPVGGVGAGDITDVGDEADGTAFTSGAEDDGNSLFFSGTTANDGFETELTVVDPTAADITVYLPNIDGVLASLAGTQTFTGNKTFTGILALTPTGSNDINITTDTDSFLNIAGLADGSGDALCIDSSNNVVTCTGGVGDGGIGGTGVANQIAYFTGTSTLASDSDLTFNGADLDYTAAYNTGFEITSNLAGGVRTASPLSITQANNVTNDYDAVYSGLLSIDNEDTGSSAPLIYLNNDNTAGTYISAPQVGALTTGTYLDIAGTPGLTTGRVFEIGSSLSSSTHTDFSGDIFYATIGKTLTGSDVVTESGNILDLSQVYTTSHASATINKTGDLATLSTTYTETSGTITDSSNILSLAQNCGTNVDCTGAVLDIVNAGTGQGMLLTSSSTGTLLDLNTSAAATTADGILIEADHASGVITDAIDVSDTQIGNALNVGANTITGSGYTINSTSGDLALTTTTSGNITATPVDANALFNILTGSLKVGNGTPGTTLDGEDAYIEGSLEVDGAIKFDNLSTSGVVLSTSGTLSSTATIGAAYITNNSLDFADFIDAMTLDASTSIAASNAYTLSLTSDISGGARTADIFSISLANDASNNFTTGNLVSFSQLDTGSSADLLEITNAGTGATFVANDAAGDTSPFVIDASGNVGIGASSPEGLLEVQGIDTADAVLVLDADNGDDNTDTWFIKALAAGNSLSLMNHTTEVANLTTGGNLQIDGNLTISGDDLFMGTNSNGYILVADGTNFNPVDATGDVDVSNAGLFTIQNESIDYTDFDLVDGSPVTDEFCLSYEDSGTNGSLEWKSCSGTTYTFSDGVSESGGTVKLGGASIDETRTITVATGGTLEIDLTSAVDGEDFVIEDGGTAFARFDNTGFFQLDNLNFNGNAISSTSGDVDIAPLSAADVDIDLAGTGGDFLVDTADGAFSIDAVGVASNITLTSNGDGEDFTVSLAGATDSSLILSSSGTAADALQITSSAGGIDILAAGAAVGEDIDITASGSSVNITGGESASDAIKFTASNAAGQILFDAGSTDKTADALVLDVDVNTASVDGLFVDLDVGTALSAAEIANGINIDVAGLGTDDAASFVNGLTITGNASVGTGVMTGIDIEGTWDADLSLQNDDTISNTSAGTIAVSGDLSVVGGDILGANNTSIDLGENVSGNISFFTNNDTDDYLYFNTTGHVPGIFWEGIDSVDPAIYTTGTELGYVDEGGAWVSFDSLGAATSAGGLDTQVQYNNGGVFGGMTSLTYNDGDDSITASDNFNFTFAGTENLAITSDLAGSVNVISLTGTPSSSAGTAYGMYISQADSANSNGFDSAFVIENLDTNLAIADGILITSAAGTITDAIDASDAEITNALNAGDNIILGAGASISFSNFGVTSAGAVTGITFDSGNGAYELQDASTANKGLASFSSSFFTVASGAVSLATNGVTTTEILDNTVSATDLAATLTFADDDLISFAAINNSDGAEGLILPQPNSCSAGTTEGQICWDADDNTLYIGDGAGGTVLVGGSGGGDITAVGDEDGGSAFTSTEEDDGNSLYFSGTTADDGFETELTAEDPTSGDISISLPNISGILASLAGAQTFAGTKTFDDITIADTSISLTGASTTFTSTGNITIGDGGDSVLIDSLDFDVDADGKVALAPDLLGDALSINFGGNVDLQALVVDATTNDSTQTAGIIDLNVDSSTNGAVLGQYLTATSVDDDAADTLYGNRTDIIIQDDTTASDTFYGNYIDITQNDTTPATVYGMSIVANDSGTSSVSGGILIDNLQATDIDLTDGVLVRATTADSIVDAFDASDAEITNALNVGQNFILGDGIRQFSASSSIWTFEDTSNNDLFKIIDQGAYGTMQLTAVNGSAPTCDAGAEGSVYSDDDDSNLYYCDGSNWIDLTVQAGTTYTAGNGLDLSGSEFQLGGTLTETTTIDQAGFDMLFNMSSTGDFRLQDGGANIFHAEADNGVMTFSDDVNFDFTDSENLGIAYSTTAPSVDMFTISNSGLATTTDGVDGLYINLVAGNGTSTDASALHLDFDPSAGSSDDTFSAILIDAITGTSAVENAISIGTGWDTAFMTEGGTNGTAFVEIGSDQTTGTLLELGAPTSTTVGASLVGMNINLNTNYTTNSGSVTGLNITLDSSTATDDTNFKGLTIGGGSLTAGNGFSPIWYGTEITTPQLDGNGEDAFAYGTMINLGSMANASEQTGVYITGSSSNASGSMYGMYLQSITPGAANEHAIYFGNGWDTQLFFGDTTTNIIQSGTVTFSDASLNSLFSIVDGGTTGNITVTGDATISGGDITGANSAVIELGEAGSGDIQMRASGDTDDYIYFDTNADLNIPALYWSGSLAYTNDPGIRVGSDGNMEYRDGDSTTWVDFDSFVSPWTDAGAYVYPTSAEVLGNSDTAGANKIAGIYLGDSSPLYFGADNDINFSFSGSTLSATLGNNDINFDSNTLFIDGSANSVGIGTATPSGLLNILGTTEQLRLSYDASNYTTFTIASTGILTLAESGTTIGTFGEAQATFEVPVAFNAAGDASYGYDLVLTNQTASKLESYGPLTIEVGESFENNNLTLTTYGTGQLMVNAAGGSTFTVSANTVATFDRTTSDGTIISLKQAGTEEGNISVSGTTVSYNAFTGSHYGWTNDTIEQGKLVKLTGNNRRYHDKPNSEILYGITETTTENDPKVFGAYLSLLEPSLPASNDNPQLIMAVGNGDMWVADMGENVEAGDYLVSSNVKGHARKDSDSFNKSFVVARAAESIDWSQVNDKVGSVKHKKISITFESFTINRLANGLANVVENTTIPAANVITTQELEGAVAGVDTQIDQVNTEIEAINERLSALETLATESTQSTESTTTTDTALLQEMTDLFNEFKSFIADLGLSSSTNEDGEQILTVESALAVLGDTTLNNLDVTGKLNAGFVQIDSLEQSIGILGPQCYNAETETYHEELCESQTLFLQKELAGNVDIFNANIVLTPEGNIVTKGTIEAKQVKTDELTIKGQTIGSATITANTTAVTISSELIKTSSKVFITPTTSTLGQTVYLKEKTTGEDFEVAIDSPVAQDIKFDWFIVNEE